MKTSIKSTIVDFLIPFLFVSSGFLQNGSGLFQGEPLPPACATQGSTANSIRFIPAANQSAPRTGRSRGGASRGNCPNTSQSLMALVPTAATGTQEALPALTVSDRPTFLFYVPYPLSADRPGEFSLLDDTGEYLYQTRITDAAASGGIIQIRLPESVPALEAGKTYNWTFQVLCESSSPIDIWGSFERIALNPELETQLQRLTAPADRAAFYAANGIWYDALSTMAALYQTDRSNPAIAANWASLLQSAGLSSIAAEPLLNCCFAPRLR